LSGAKELSQSNGVHDDSADYENRIQCLEKENQELIRKLTGNESTTEQ